MNIQCARSGIGEKKGKKWSKAGREIGVHRSSVPSSLLHRHSCLWGSRSCRQGCHAETTQTRGRHPHAVANPSVGAEQRKSPPGQNKPIFLTDLGQTDKKLVKGLATSRELELARSGRLESSAVPDILLLSKASGLSKHLASTALKILDRYSEGSATGFWCSSAGPQQEEGLGTSERADSWVNSWL